MLRRRVEGCPVSERFRRRPAPYEKSAARPEPDLSDARLERARWEGGPMPVCECGRTRLGRAGRTGAERCTRRFGRARRLSALAGSPTATSASREEPQGASEDDQARGNASSDATASPLPAPRLFDQCFERVDSVRKSLEDGCRMGFNRQHMALL
jgi:hypothetical protein